MILIILPLLSSPAGEQNTHLDVLPHQKGKKKMKKYSSEVLGLSPTALQLPLWMSINSIALHKVEIKLHVNSLKNK